MADPLSYLGGVVQGRYTPQRDRIDLETDLKYRTALAEAYARLAGAETDLHKGVFATWGNAANAYVSGIANIAKAMAEAGRADAEAMKAAADRQLRAKLGDMRLDFEGVRELEKAKNGKTPVVLFEMDEEPAKS